MDLLLGLFHTSVCACVSIMVCCYNLYYFFVMFCLPVHYVPLRKREILSIDVCPKLAKYNLNDYVFKAATQSFVPQSESFQYFLV